LVRKHRPRRIGFTSHGALINMNKQHTQLRQAMKDASSFRALVLIGAAAAFCAAFTPHGTKPCVVSTLAEANHPVMCPPQWLPVLLAFHSGQDDSPKSPFDGDVEDPAIRARPASALSEPRPLYTDPLSLGVDKLIKAAAGVMCSLL